MTRSLHPRMRIPALSRSEFPTTVWAALCSLALVGSAR